MSTTQILLLSESAERSCEQSSCPVANSAHLPGCVTGCSLTWKTTETPHSNSDLHTPRKPHQSAVNSEWWLRIQWAFCLNYGAGKSFTCPKISPCQDSPTTSAKIKASLCILLCYPESLTKTCTHSQHEYVCMHTKGPARTFLWNVLLHNMLNTSFIQLRQWFTALLRHP